MPSNPLEAFDTQADPGIITILIPRAAPYVGQIVHYWPLQCEKTHDHEQPFRADVCHINDNGTVNLVIYNEVGIASRRTQVPILAHDVVKSGEASMFL